MTRRRPKKKPARRRRPAIIRSLEDLVPDPHNANKGTPRGQAMLDQSIRTSGAGRGIMADRYGRVIAGNKTLKRALALGLKLQLVKTRGDRLVVHQREDLDLATDPRAKALALADNRVAEVGLDWDADIVAGLKAAGVDLGALWTEDELVRFIATAGSPDTSPQMGALEYRIMVDCHDEAHQKLLLERFEADGLTVKAVIS